MVTSLQMVSTLLYCCCEASNSNNDSCLSCCCGENQKEELGVELLELWSDKTLPELRIVFKTPADEEVLFVFTERPLGMNFKRAKSDPKKSDPRKGEGVGAKVTRATLPPAAGTVTKGTSFIFRLRYCCNFLNVLNVIKFELSRRI